VGWDEFTSTSIDDPHLEAIRKEAELIQLPIADSSGWTKLRDLLQRVAKI
jgi:hypothetical protein